MSTTNNQELEDFLVNKGLTDQTGPQLIQLVQSLPKPILIAVLRTYIIMWFQILH
jgi:hypothetical protein